MKIQSIQGRFKVLTIQIQYIDENGGEKSETMNVKYRPLTRDWFAGVEETQRQLEKIKNDTVERVQKLGELLQKQNLLQSLFDTAKEDEKQKANAELESHNKIVEQERALLETFLDETKEASSNLLAKQLLPIVIDLDLIDEKGEKVAPTLEVLNSLDYELLYEILNGIKKKMTQT